MSSSASALSPSAAPAESSTTASAEPLPPSSFSSSLPHSNPSSSRPSWAPPPVPASAHPEYASMSSEQLSAEIDRMMTVDHERWKDEQRRELEKHKELIRFRSKAMGMPVPQGLEDIYLFDEDQPGPPGTASSPPPEPRADLNPPSSSPPSSVPSPVPASPYAHYATMSSAQLGAEVERVMTVDHKRWMDEQERLSEEHKDFVRWRSKAMRMPVPEGLDDIRFEGDGPGRTF